MVMEPRTALVAKEIIYVCLEHKIVRGAIVGVKPNKWRVFRCQRTNSFYINISTPRRVARLIVFRVSTRKTKNPGADSINSLMRERVRALAE